MRSFIFSACMCLLLSPAAYALNSGSNQPEGVLSPTMNDPKEWNGKILNFDTQKEKEVGSAAITTPFGTKMFSIFTDKNENEILSFHANLFDGSEFRDGFVKVNSEPSIMEYKNKNNEILYFLWATDSKKDSQIIVNTCIMNKPTATCSSFPLQKNTPTNVKLYDSNGNNIAKISIHSATK